MPCGEGEREKWQKSFEEGRKLQEDVVVTRR
jgi:hypothetical protein